MPEGLEKEILEYKKKNILLKHFKKLSRVHVSIPEEIFGERLFTKKLLKNKLHLTNQIKIYTKDGIISPSSYPFLYKEIHDLYFEYMVGWSASDHYSTMDSNTKWIEVSHKFICDKYNIHFDKNIRFSTLWKWFDNNGSPI